MKTVNIHEAKTHLSRLVEEVAAGAEVVIARAGRPVARLVPMGHAASARKPGLLKGRVEVAEEFDSALPPAVLAQFYGAVPKGHARRKKP